LSILFLKELQVCAFKNGLFKASILWNRNDWRTWEGSSNLHGISLLEWNCKESITSSLSPSFLWRRKSQGRSYGSWCQEEIKLNDKEASWCLMLVIWSTLLHNLWNLQLGIRRTCQLNSYPYNWSCNSLLFHKASQDSQFGCSLFKQILNNKRYSPS